jgi:isopenicillin N synthase-like dioxygenase
MVVMAGPGGTATLPVIDVGPLTGSSPAAARSGRCTAPTGSRPRSPGWARWCWPYLEALTGLGQAVLAGVALSLGLDSGYFATGYTADPTILFRIFHYPPAPPGASGWGVGEHTDYGLLTLLAQDDSGGLQVPAPEGWIDAPPIPGTLVANIGDMLDRLTGGWYRSTPHRVRNLSGHGRLSFPFFLDPGFAAEVPPLAGRAAAGDDGRRRWDGQDLRAFTGT